MVMVRKSCWQGWWIGWLLVTVSCLSCVHKRKPGLRVEVTPTGAKLEARKVSSIVATFSRPMVAPAAVGQAANAPPLTLKPEVRGKYRWTTERTLTFVPDAPLARSTEYSLVIPEGTKALDGHELDSAFEWSFATERIEAQLTLKTTAGHPSAVRWATPDQSVLVELSQPTQPSALKAACGFRAGDVSVGVAVSDAEGDTAGKRFVLGPSSPLSLGTQWTLGCKQSLRGVEGPVGLVHDEETTFETYGPMRVVSIKPDHDDVDLDDTEIAIRLSNPLSQAVKKLPFTITPSVRGFPERVSEYDGTYKLTVNALEPNTAYTIRVAAPLTDAFGQTLSTPVETKFRTGDAKPRMDVQTGSWAVEAARGGFPIWVRNISKIEATMAEVPVERVASLLPELDWWDGREADLKKANIRGVKKTLKVPARHNHWQQYELSPARTFGATAKPTGLFYFSLQAPEVKKTEDGQAVRELLVNLTNLGLTSKMAAGAGLVWVTALDTGRPVVDAEVLAISRGGRTIWQGKTDPEGVARTPGTDELTKAARRGTGKKKGRSQNDSPIGLEENPEAASDFDGEGGGNAPEFILVARVGDDTTFVNPQYAGGLARYNFSLRDGGASVAPLRGYMHSDRGLYRPGDTAHLKGLVRVMRPGEGLRVPNAHSAKVVVNDPRGQEVLTRECKVGAFGSFALDVPIAEDARLGDYQVTATIEGTPFHERFSVEEYRPNNFEVKVDPAAKRYTVGQTLRAKVNGRYFYGAPMRKGKVHWTVHSSPHDAGFEAFSGYEFGLDEYGSSDSQALFSEEDQTLDDTGNATLSLKLAPKDLTRRADLLVSATVEDETHQAVTQKTVIPVHASDRYFGIRPESWVFEVGKPGLVRALSVDVDGVQVAARAKLSIHRRDWHCAYESWGYRGNYRCESVTQEVATHDLALAAAEPAEVRFTPVRSGEYEIRIEGKDTAGRKVASMRRVWAWGGNDEASWRTDDTHRFDIVADKEQYRPGETAHLVLKASVAPDTVGLLTIERDQVLEHKLVNLGGPQTVLDVPLSLSEAPNVYVSLLLVTGRSGRGPRGLPSLRMGMADLRVRPEGKELHVTVNPDREEYRPGDTVTATVEVKDSAGAPVKAELALSAADEGVLSLIDFKTPDPSATFWAPWGLGITTATQYDRMVQLPEPGAERDATGGDGSGRLGSLRSRFRATAYWNPQVETDDLGRAVVTFKAPDNLTAFRLMAVAADQGDRFGSADKRFTVRKPLQLLSALPRFLSVGDEIMAGVLVLNETGAKGEVAVDLAAEGVKLEGSLHRTVTVPQGGRVPVYVRARADKSGEAKMRFSASLGGEKDGLEVKLPVVYPAPYETELIEQGVFEGSREIALKLPEGVFPGTASVSISLDPDGLAGMEQGLAELVQYPYGCLEQTTSRLIPLVMVEELSKSLNLPGLDGPNLQRFIRAGIGKIGRHQTEEGGFSLWPNGEAESYLTAYALFGLKVAASAGHPVDPKRVEAGLSYLRGSLSGNPKAGGVHNELGELGGRAFGLYVLALYGKPDAAGATRLLEQKGQLPRFGQAFLARALAKSLGTADASVTGLIDELLASAQEHDGRLSLSEGKDAALSYYMSDDLRTTAIFADTLQELRPNHPAIPNLVAELMAHRRDGRYGGGWYSTQDNLYALLALSHYSKAQTRNAPTVLASLGARKILSADLSKGGGVRVRHAELSWSEVQPRGQALVLSAEGGKAHYAVRFRYQRDLAHQRAESEGMTLGREYLDPRTDAPISTVKAGDTVRVRVTIHSAEERYHLAVTDYLPAGLEPVQSKFVTSASEPSRPGGSADESQWWIEHKEIHDDRVDVFAEYLWHGDHDFSYLARATTPGKFHTPGAHAEEMYDPDVRARLAPTQFEVTAQ